MRAKFVIGLLLCLVILGLPSAASAAAYSFELFAGYFLPEELDEDLTYGLRFGHRGDANWGWDVAGSWFDVSDSQGFSGADVDADLLHVDFSLNYYPGGGQFYFFGGPGWVTGNVDVPGTREELSDDAFTLHAGLGWEALVGESFFIPIDARARWYELEGWGPDGGKDSQLTYEATIGLGWRF